MPIVLETSNIHIVSISIDGPVSVQDMSETQYTAFLTFSNNQVVAVSPVWSLEQNSVGAILAEGLLSVPNTGSSNLIIRATYTDQQTVLSTALSVGINDVFVVSDLAIEGSGKVDATQNTQVTLIARARYSDSTTNQVAADWTLIGNSAGCTIDSNGLLTILGQSQETVITVGASYTEAEVTVSQQFIITLSTTFILNLLKTASSSLIISGDTIMSDNNTFINSSASGVGLTRNGLIGQGAYSPLYPYWSYHFNGVDAVGNTGAYLGSEMMLANSQTTIEFWVKPVYSVNANSWYTTIIGNIHPVTQSGRWGIFLVANGAANANCRLAFIYTTASNATQTVLDSTYNIACGAWTHVMVTINATTPSSSAIKFFVNGAQTVSTSVNLSNHTVAYSNWYIGGGITGKNSLQGYLADLRICKSLVQTASFTVPDKPLPITATTSLLTCNSPKFEDASRYDHFMTGPVTASQPLPAPISPYSMTNTDVPVTATNSAYFGGSVGNYLKSDLTTLLGLGANDFTLELWMCPFNVAQTGRICGINDITFGTGYPSITFYYTGSYVYAAASSNGTSWDAVYATALSAVTNGQWTHLAVSRSGNNMYWFVNGGLKLTSNISGKTFLNSNRLHLGWDGISTDGTRFNGFITDARVVDSCLYTTSFTPGSDVPLTAIAGTKILTARAPTPIDESANAIPVSIVGTVSFLPISPYTSTYVTASSQYNPSVNGGSAYFDGSSGNYLTTDTFAADNSQFTIEFWICPFSVTRFCRVLNITTVSGGSAFGAFSLYIDTNGWLKLAMSNNVTSWNVLLPTNIVPLWDGMWVHVAISRDASNKVRTFCNGRMITETQTVAMTGASASKAYIGWDGFSNDTYRYNGYVSGLRVVVGDCLYTGGFTPSRTPLVDTPNTKVLCKFTNGAILDGAIMSDMTTNAMSSQNLARQGSGALYFDGTGYAIIYGRPEYNQLSGVPFTIEFWIRPTLSSRQIMGCNASSSTVGWRIDQTTASIAWKSNNAQICTCEYLPNVWTHLAFVYDGTVLKLYKNGIYTDGATTAWTNSSDPLYIGLATIGGTKFTGYLDSIRFSYGEQVYTTDFEVDPPTYVSLDKSTGSKRRYTQLLIPGDGALSKNDVVLDIAQALAITNAGSYTSSFSPYDDHWSTYFDGNTDGLSAPASSDYNFSVGDFSVECWIRLLDVPSPKYFVVGTADPGTGANGWCVVLNNTPTLALMGGGGTILTSPYTWASGKWMHLAVTRVGTTYNLFIDGALQGSGAGDGAPNNVDGMLYIGCHPSYPSLGLNGSISNLRIVKGSCLYVKAFDVPTSKLTAVPGTVLLTCQNSSFKENSSNKTLTVVQTPKIKSIDPFIKSQNTISSANFASSAAYLSVPANVNYAFGTGDFSIELWICPTAFRSIRLLTTKVGGSAQAGTWAFNLSATSLSFTETTSPETGITGFCTFIANCWYHVVAVRSGTTLSLYVNGKRVGTGALTTDFSVAANNLFIGNSPGDSGAYFSGQMSNIRIVKGSAIYNPSLAYITVPDILEPVTGTQLLTLQTNGLTDSSPNAVIITNSSASLGVYDPYRKGSIMCDTGMYSTTGSIGSLNGTDWTIEATVYYTATQASTACWIQSQQGKNNWVPYLSIGVNSGGYAECCINGAGYTTTAKIPVGAWTHMALVRSSGTVSLYIDGISVLSRTDNIDNVALSFFVGRASNAPGGGSAVYDWQGNICNLRILTTAAYTTTFTPPSTLHQPSASSLLLLRGNNAGLYDSMNTFGIKNYGSVASTTSKKYGSHSFTCTSTGSTYLTIKKDPLLAFNGDFTIEFWANLSPGYIGYRVPFALDSSGNSSNTLGWCMWMQTWDNAAFYVANSVKTAAAITLSLPTPSTSVWHHYAVTRNNNTWKVFFDGALINSVVTAVSPPSPIGDFLIGGGTTAYFNGDIDNFKITIGECLYNLAFTPV